MVNPWLIQAFVAAFGLAADSAARFAYGRRSMADRDLAVSALNHPIIKSVEVTEHGFKIEKYDGADNFDFEGGEGDEWDDGWDDGDEDEDYWEGWD